MWDVQAVSDLDIGHRTSLSEILEALVSAGRASWEKVIWE